MFIVCWCPFCFVVSKLGLTMPRYNIKCPSGNWRIFSTVVNDFITDEITDEEFIRWRLEEYGEQGGSIEESLKFINTGSGLNSMSYNEAIEIIEYAKKEREDEEILISSDKSKRERVFGVSDKVANSMAEHLNRIDITQFGNTKGWI